MFGLSWYRSWTSTGISIDFSLVLVLVFLGLGVVLAGIDLSLVPASVIVCLGLVLALGQSYVLAVSLPGLGLVQ